jgi:hypothetical protein
MHLCNIAGTTSKKKEFRFVFLETSVLLEGEAVREFLTIDGRNSASPPLASTIQRTTGFCGKFVPSLPAMMIATDVGLMGGGADP